MTGNRFITCAATPIVARTPLDLFTFYFISLLKFGLFLLFKSNSYAQKSVLNLLSIIRLFIFTQIMHTFFFYSNIFF